MHTADPSALAPIDLVHQVNNLDETPIPLPFRWQSANSLVGRDPYS
jgi:hypothetical protein